MADAASAVRPFRRSDAEVLPALTQASILLIGARAYSTAQTEAWAARHLTAERFIARAAKGDLILIASTASDLPVAYALLEGDGHVDMLYCHPDHAGRGIGTRLLIEVEQAARAAGLSRLYTEASELARPVFARAGYSLVARRDFRIPCEGGDVAIHNYAMDKRLS